LKVLAAAALAGAVIFLAWLRHMHRRHGAGPLLWRWLSGAALDGRIRGEDEPGWWHLIPRPRRAAIRGGGTILVPLLVWAYFAYTAVFMGAATIAGTAAVYAGGWLAFRKVRNWQHDRNWVNPLNEALPPAVTVHQLPRSREYLELAAPVGLVPDDTMKKQIMLAATTKLNPKGTLEADWSKLYGKKPRIPITLIKPPPGYVSFADILEYIEAAAEHEIVFGLGRVPRGGKKYEPGIISVDSDSPHIGLSMGSGDGKSVTARGAACQLAHHGALIVNLDTKFVSQHWAAGLPNVAYARYPEEIHNLALWLWGEVSARKALALRFADVEGIVHANPGPRIVGILEELNATQTELSAYWKSIGGKGRSPAVTALDNVSNIGRQVLVNLLYIGQRLSAKAVSGGSGDARENLGVLLMSNPSVSTWRMLVGDRHPLPPATEEQGRLQVVTAKKVLEVQGAYWTGAQAREFAMSGRVADPPDGMPYLGGIAPLGTPERAAWDVQDITAIEGQRPDLHVVQDSPRLPALSPRITIRQAIEEGISGPTVDAVKKALRPDRQRPGITAPLPVGTRGNADEYDRTEWCDWEEARRQPRRLTR
jgi:hypothetical protein